MAYRDPYYSSSNDPYYSQAPPQQPPHFQQPYTDEFDPYNARQVHPTYDQSGYTDEEGFPNAGPRNAALNAAGEDSTGAGHTREKSTYEEQFPPVLRPPKSTGAIRIWRKDHYGDMWTKGSRGACIGRFCCCTLFVGIFLLVSIVLSLLIWIRPPDIQVNNVGFPATGSAFQVTSDSLNLNLAVNISVANPNYFAVNFKRIKADLTYPINNLDVGGGEKDNIVFHSHTQTTFNFPFTLSYNETSDPNHAVLEDLLTKCGIMGSTKSNIDVKYKITLGVRILFVTISPSFSNDFSFACPFSANDISDLLKGSGISIPGITSK